ncbi:MAG TPA: YggS family pyridoxal phosphate-dependent enzyme [Rhodospirillales bacterium]|nr:YggS family pyridoxal phosphate-dependent enzyme [Rhodospirillales bacterium]
MTTDIAANLAQVKSAIAAAAQDCDRGADPVSLIAVSKTQPGAAIEAALATGHRHFGENRVQEAEQKWPDLKTRYDDLSLHLIGPLQSNKVRLAVALFDVIETVDREKLARALAREMAKTDRHVECLVQVNTGEEQQKAGIWPQQADAFIALCRDDLGLPVIGLMCIPPVSEQAALHFALLREIAQRNDLPHLSMGMSADYAMAVRFGATMVRVGSGIFGARAPMAQ